MDSTQIFRSAWSLYDSIVEANYMSHREIQAAVGAVIAARAGGGAYTLLDLGCGNARGLLATLRAASPTWYLGVDLSRPALDEAAVALAGLPSVELREQEMQATATALADGGVRFDLIYSGFAVHHLAASDKRRLFQTLAKVLRPEGCLILVDVVREAGQSREQYLEEYLQMVRTEWLLLDPAQTAEVCGHIAAHDFPETWEDLASMAQAAGLGNGRVLSRHRQHWAMQFS